ncbi:nucleotidyl transferase AbiEii/AbiGii toxin family protein [candidate division KSB1 bacterium]|nr:nucleotidyl transferase AbiEii/AbiGii toxin family protein [candidate division KSB1 bacterium]MBL7094965.1 nucleotidyl transferase AbiEii/AbiGii toxin family protein [candidate division KSB1 bacterium]
MLELKQIESFYPEPMRVFKRNLLREYLQYKILDIIFNTEFSNKLVFMGGTANRIVHGNNRFSEDLDFDNFNLNNSEFKNLTEIISKKLSLEGYEVETRNIFKGAFHCYIGFRNLLYETKLSGHKKEKLMIRLDTEAQGIEYDPDKIILNKFDVFTRINVVPRPMLLAQKILAILYRKRSMGRDFYDTIFLLSNTRPDFDYLKIKADIKTIDELKSRLGQKCQVLNFKQLAKDVEPFLINHEDTKRVLLFYDYIKNL